jgi:hypothetical protein
MERPNGNVIENDEEANASDPADTGASVRPKPYLSIRELSALTPWTEQAIRTMITKGVLKEGEHFFHVGRRTVLKWEAVVEFIEHKSYTDRSAITHYRDARPDARKA